MRRPLTPEELTSLGAYRREVDRITYEAERGHRNIDDAYKLVAMKEKGASILEKERLEQAWLLLQQLQQRLGAGALTYQAAGDPEQPLVGQAVAA